MYYEIYLDVFFFLNLWMNMVSCRLLAVFLRKHARMWKISAVSFAASFAACLIVIFPLGKMGARMTAGQIVLSPLIVYVLFGERGAAFLKSLAAYYLVAFLFGGAILFLEPRLTFLGILIAGTAVEVALEAFYRIFGAEQQRYIHDIVVKCGGNDYALKALFDSGNSLLEPILKEQVHIIGESAAERLGLRENTDGMRAIPFHSVGRENGVMMGYYAQELRVMREGAEMCIPHPLIGVSKEELSVKKEYEMILNSKIFD